MSVEKWAQQAGVQPRTIWKILKNEGPWIQKPVLEKIIEVIGYESVEEMMEDVEAQDAASSSLVKAGTFKRKMKAAEKRYLVYVLGKTKGNLYKTSRLLDIPIRSLYNKLHQHEIDPNDYRTARSPKIISLTQKVNDAEAIYLRRVLIALRGCVPDAARRLGISRERIYGLLKKHDMKASHFVDLDSSPEESRMRIMPWKEKRSRVEKKYILKALRMSKWNILNAAEMLGISERKLHGRIKSVGIDVKRQKEMLDKTLEVIVSLEEKMREAASKYNAQAPGETCGDISLTAGLRSFDRKDFKRRRKELWINAEKHMRASNDQGLIGYQQQALERIEGLMKSIRKIGPYPHRCLELINILKGHRELVKRVRPDIASNTSQYLLQELEPLALSMSSRRSPKWNIYFTLHNLIVRDRDEEEIIFYIWDVLNAGQATNLGKFYANLNTGLNDLYFIIKEKLKKYDLFEAIADQSGNSSDVLLDDEIDEAYAAEEKLRETGDDAQVSEALIEEMEISCLENDSSSSVIFAHSVKPRAGPVGGLKKVLPQAAAIRNTQNLIPKTTSSSFIRTVIIAAFLLEFCFLGRLEPYRARLFEVSKLFSYSPDLVFLVVFINGLMHGYNNRQRNHVKKILFVKKFVRQGPRVLFFAACPFILLAGFIGLFYSNILWLFLIPVIYITSVNVGCLLSGKGYRSPPETSVYRAMQKAGLLEGRGKTYEDLRRGKEKDHNRSSSAGDDGSGRGKKSGKGAKGKIIPLFSKKRQAMQRNCTQEDSMKVGAQDYVAKESITRSLSIVFVKRLVLEDGLFRERADGARQTQQEVMEQIENFFDGHIRDDEDMFWAYAQKSPQDFMRMWVREFLATYYQEDYFKAVFVPGVMHSKQTFSSFLFNSFMFVMLIRLYTGELKFYVGGWSLHDRWLSFHDGVTLQEILIRGPDVSQTLSLYPHHFSLRPVGQHLLSKSDFGKKPKVVIQYFINAVVLLNDFVLQEIESDGIARLKSYLAYYFAWGLFRKPFEILEQPHYPLSMVYSRENAKAHNLLCKLFPESGDPEYFRHPYFRSDLFPIRRYLKKRNFMNEGVMWEAVSLVAVFNVVYELLDLKEIEALMLREMQSLYKKKPVVSFEIYCAILAGAEAFGIKSEKFSRFENWARLISDGDYDEFFVGFRRLYVKLTPYIENKKPRPATLWRLDKNGDKGSSSLGSEGKIMQSKMRPVSSSSIFEKSDPAFYHMLVKHRMIWQFFIVISLNYPDSLAKQLEIAILTQLLSESEFLVFLNRLFNLSPGDSADVFVALEFEILEYFLNISSLLSEMAEDSQMIRDFMLSSGYRTFIELRHQAVVIFYIKLMAPFFTHVTLTPADKSTRVLSGDKPLSVYRVHGRDIYAALPAIQDSKDINEIISELYQDIKQIRGEMAQVGMSTASIYNFSRRGQRLTGMEHMLEGVSLLIDMLKRDEALPENILRKKASSAAIKSSLKKHAVYFCGKNIFVNGGMGYELEYLLNVNGDIFVFRRNNLDLFNREKVSFIVSFLSGGREEMIGYLIVNIGRDKNNVWIARVFEGGRPAGFSYTLCDDESFYIQKDFRKNSLGTRLLSLVVTYLKARENIEYLHYDISTWMQEQLKYMLAKEFPKNYKDEIATGRATTWVGALSEERTRNVMERLKKKCDCKDMIVSERLKSPVSSSVEERKRSTYLINPVGESASEDYADYFSGSSWKSSFSLHLLPAKRVIADVFLVFQGTDAALKKQCTRVINNNGTLADLAIQVDQVLAEMKRRGSRVDEKDRRSSAINNIISFNRDFDLNEKSKEIRNTLDRAIDAWVQERKEGRLKDQDDLIKAIETFFNKHIQDVVPYLFLEYKYYQSKTLIMWIVQVLSTGVLSGEVYHRIKNCIDGDRVHFTNFLLNSLIVVVLLRVYVLEYQEIIADWHLKDRAIKYDAGLYGSDMVIRDFRFGHIRFFLHDAYPFLLDMPSFDMPAADNHVIDCDLLVNMETLLNDFVLTKLKSSDFPFLKQNHVPLVGPSFFSNK
ncbi:helix-turn-helix domain-containing protein [Candidatus Omnitrophota bacterium]